MSFHSRLASLRDRLDREITYGTIIKAMKLARQGLLKAEEAGLLAEQNYFRGQIALLRKNYATAIEYFDSAIKLNPKDGAAYNDRALCMVELGIIEEAFEYFDKGINAEPDYSTVYHNKAWLLNNIGRYTESVVYFNKALSLDKDRAVTYDGLADSLYNLGDIKGALKAYKKTLSLLKDGQCRSIKNQIIEKIRLLEGEIQNQGEYGYGHKDN
ncbi:MAG: tetratricopeptide repeat protein [Candidatus Omnitrophota bacterium]|jgi:tetratricopeptide (TPR) repeat protein|nr:MAG: tetratricopeptide repeat protein [Candidatus Omnitrophota bacterium]